VTATLSRLRESARAARSTPPVPPPAGNPERPGWSARAHSVRFRVVAAMLLMMFAGLVVAGLITFAVQFQDSDARTDQALLDKAHAVVKLVPGKERSDRQALQHGLHEAAEDIEPRSNEVMAGITEGKVEWTVTAAPARTSSTRSCIPAPWP
jgi:two-component system OmpR family sensor kinase